jgi:serine/threonine protein kinase
VYSLGCVLYEMLIGEPPGMWVTADSVQRGTFTDLPERHRAPMRDVERPVERALVRALAIRAHDRFDAVSAFLLALRADAGAVRRYSDSEVEEIVRQAADEQAAHPTEQGMSLRTVQQIADDVGISAERVQCRFAPCSRLPMTSAFRPSGSNERRASWSFATRSSPLPSPVRRSRGWAVRR